MKISPQTKRSNHVKAHAFTLIEMIGVLAVIAILAALLIPKVFNAINDAKINNTLVSTETIKTALADHYGKYGKFDTLNGTTPLTAPINGYDTNVLMPESLIDKPFITKLGTNWNVQCLACPAPGTTAVTTGDDGTFDLAGSGTNSVAGQYVMQAIISGVAEADAEAISARLDGNTMTPTALGTDDLKGRVKYAQAGGGATTVYIYLTHR
jgi:prepilin-type N-terminal cleavage/methylation domain-containing protein